MIDIEVTRSGELMVAGVQGLTDPGVEFVDSFVADQIVVVDADRIVIPDELVPHLLALATVAGLAVRQKEGV